MEVNEPGWGIFQRRMSCSQLDEVLRRTCVALRPAATRDCYSCLTTSCSQLQSCVCTFRLILTTDSGSRVGLWQTSTIIFIQNLFTYYLVQLDYMACYTSLLKSGDMHMHTKLHIQPIYSYYADQSELAGTLCWDPEDFVGSKFYHLHAFAHNNWQIWISDGVTIHPGFPKHILFLGLCPGFLAGYQKSVVCLSFWPNLQVYSNVADCKGVRRHETKKAH